MAKWRKRFAAWEQAKQPVSVDEAEAILKKVFGGRLAEHKGGSHRWTVDAPELKGQGDEYLLGMFGVPVKNGQRVLPAYLRLAHEAAGLLGLPLEDAEGENDEDDE